ncbi:LysR family transcriptional regulator [Nocardia sp. NPDC059239]|uniref:LysR family transcriptional regulator n=1 Tax=Nocardia sp. NPDC059239 TaxID=3346785 RepID=UPI0036AAD691
MIPFLPPKQVRTFLAVARPLSFAGCPLHSVWGSPHASQLIHKLERATGKPLLVRDTRTVRLTVDGKTMVVFAWAILNANTEAADHFSGAGVRGRLRFDGTEDLTLTRVSRNPTGFRHLNPYITLDLTASQGAYLVC